MKSVFSKKVLPDPELPALRAELQSAQAELTCAYQQFNLATDPELVESCIYQINAVKARCNYLIRTIKTHSGESAVPEVPAARKSRKRLPKRAQVPTSISNPMGQVLVQIDGEDAVWV